MTAPIVFVDTETDSLGPDRKVWDVAVIRREHHPDGQVVEREWQAFLPMTLTHSDPQALTVGGFWDRHPQGRQRAGRDFGGPQPELADVRTVARKVMTWTFGATLVGINPGFDAHCLERLLLANGCTPMWHHHLLDLVSMSLGWRRIPNDMRHAQMRSDDLAALCGAPLPDPATRHTALGDARFARAWYDHLTGPARTEAAS